MSEERARCAWFGSARAWHAARAEGAWIAAIERGFEKLTGRRAAPTQRAAWADQAALLDDALAPDSELELAFEYEIPGEGGRRPDLIALGAAGTGVVEFKMKGAARAADLDQARAYARDLALYHELARDQEVRAALALTRRERRAPPSAPARPDDRARAIGRAELGAWLFDLGGAPPIPIRAWLDGAYAPLPSIVEAARQIWEGRDLGALQRAPNAAALDRALASIRSASARAKKRSEHHAVLVTGVPGSGKTLLGLRFAHQAQPDRAAAADALFLTGNDPLTRVLQRALGSKVFVRPIRQFYKEYIERNASLAGIHRLVFDEAQRAWDVERMRARYELAETSQAALMSTMARENDWSVLVALVGEGQKIHVGEENTIEAWGEAAAEAKADWILHAPARIAAQLGRGAIADDALDLDLSVRGHAALEARAWAERVLEGQDEAARALAAEFERSGFTLRACRDVEQAADYARARYAEAPTKRYGWIASSRARIPERYGIPNGYLATRNLDVGAWYLDPPDSPRSCCQLDRAVTEFGCQGLELDLPLVCWGEDARREGGAWRLSARGKAKDPAALRRNAYRVLLTRARDGHVLVVPPDPRLDETWAFLLASGARAL